MGVLSDLIEAEFGVNVRSSARTVAVGTGTSEVLQNNDDRLGVLVMNLGSDEAFITPTGVPSASNGIRLGPNGGGLAIGWRDDFTLPGIEWNGAAPSGAVTVIVVEVIALGGPGTA